MNSAFLVSWSNVLGWMLIHFLWQGMIVGIALWTLLALLPKNFSRIRYLTSVLALVIICMLPMVTISKIVSMEVPPVEPLSPTISAVLPSGLSGEIVAADSSATISKVLQVPSSKISGLVSLDPLLPWLVGGWVIGVFFAEVNLIRSCLTLNRWRRQGAVPETSEWKERFRRLSDQLGLQPQISLLESSRLSVPMVVGWLKPAVLVPVGFLTSLPVKHVEAILLHELAHVRRGDFLINFLQSWVETLFYFHPAVLWIGKQIRAEREFCCDQMAARYCGGNLVYAKALTALEECREPRLLGVAANGGALLDRIQRLSNSPKNSMQVFPIVGLAVSLAICVLVYASLTPTAEAEVRASKTTVFDDEVELVDSPEVNVDGKPALLIRVLDAASNEPIESFIAVAGVPIRREMLEADAADRFPDSPWVNWQSHTARSAQGGEFYWELRKAYQPLCLRIETEGYVPQQFSPIDKERGSQTITFRLKKDSGVQGQVLLPSGEPAAKALIGVGITSRQLAIQDGVFGNYDSSLSARTADEWSRPIIVEADGDGRFVLPTEVDPSAHVAAIHEGGICFTQFQTFSEQKTMKLKNWGQLEGTVKVGTVAAPGESVSVYVELIRGYPSSVIYWVDVQSDEEGRIAVRHVAPGSANWQLEGFRPREDRPSFNNWEWPKTPQDATGSVFVRSGETQSVILGGEALGEIAMNSRGEYRIDVDESGGVKINGSRVDRAELPALDSAVTIIINPVPNAKYEDVMSVYEHYTPLHRLTLYFSQGSGFWPKRE